MSTPSEFRTDRNRNPTAFTIDVAHEGGLVLGTDYEAGDPFEAGGRTYYTAKLLDDPLMLTQKVLRIATFYTRLHQPRWSYIAIPDFVWQILSPAQKVDVIGWMYEREAGTEMRGLFPRL